MIVLWSNLSHDYTHTDPVLAAAFVERLADDMCDTDNPIEVRSLGRTLRRWKHQIDAWHQAHVSNGPTEAANNLIKRVKRAAFGFTSFRNYRIRSLLYAGWQESIANVIAKVCELGAAGKIDAFLAGLKDHDLEQEAVQIGWDAWPHRLSTEVAFAKRILERVQAFVSTHPFVASCGRYFGAVAPESEIATSEPTSA